MQKQQEICVIINHGISFPKEVQSDLKKCDVYFHEKRLKIVWKAYKEMDVINSYHCIKYMVDWADRAVGKSFSCLFQEYKS